MQHNNAAHVVGQVDLPESVETMVARYDDVLAVRQVKVDDTVRVRTVLSDLLQDDGRRVGSSVVGRRC